MSSSLKIPLTEKDHHHGHLHASVFLLEYGDFECPHCAAAAPLFENIIHQFGSDLCFFYRHFPIETSHPHATFAAIASEAAGQQARFWEMHHSLFENFDSLNDQIINQIARSLELDMERFALDIKRPDLFDKVRNDFNSGIQSGVTETPTLYVNNEKFEGPLSSLKEFIQEKVDISRAEYSL